MDIFNNLYKKNKELDLVFDKYYDMHNIDIIRKNKLELIVEIGELANETKCFKYWSNKNINLDNVFEELADCIIMTMTLFNLLNIEMNDDFKQIKINYDMTELFARLFFLSSNFYYDENKDFLKEIFVLLINIGHMLNKSDDEIVLITLNKIKKNFDRFEVNNEN